jgi:ribosomal protein S18 acetylase RimI-like enzyme
MREFYAESSYMLDQSVAASSFSTLLSNPALGGAWIVFEGSVAAGYVVLTLRFSMEYGGRDGFVDDLFVKPAFRRRGVARSALQAVIAESERIGLRALHVVVGSDYTAAKALYAEFGFRPPSDGRETLTAQLRAGS